MRLLLFAAVLLAAGCRGATDPCDGFPLQSCLALRLRGAIGSVDQIEVTALSGFSLPENRTPQPAGAPFTLPVLVPIVLQDFAGDFSLLARGLREGGEIAFGTASGSLRAREHKIVEVTLVPPLPLDGGADAACSPSLETDPRHCGRCDNDCTALPFVDEGLVRCVMGVCDLTGACRSGHANCTRNPETGCESEISTAANCGACRAACPDAAPLCARDDNEPTGYACIVGCGGATPDRCGASCVDLASDPEHCGSCDRRCDLPVGGTAVCNAGGCDFTCAAGAKKIGAECLEWEPETSNITTRIHAVWGSSPSDLWAVGAEGVVLRSSGDGKWNTFHDFGGYDLYGVGGTSANDVLISGGIYIQRWDGMMFTGTALGVPQFGVSIKSGIDQWSSGFNTAFRRDGTDIWTSKSSFPSGIVAHNWGVAAFDSIVFLVGLNSANGTGVILQTVNRGDVWITAAQGTFPTLNAIWGDEPENLYACGYTGAILRRTGVIWHTEASGTTVKLSGGARPAAGAVYVVGDQGAVLFSTEDGRWIPQRTGTVAELRGVWGQGADVWAVGAGGVILRKVK